VPQAKIIAITCFFTRDEVHFLRMNIAAQGTRKEARRLLKILESVSFVNKKYLYFLDTSSAGIAMLPDLRKDDYYFLILSLLKTLEIEHTCLGKDPRYLVPHILQKPDFARARSTLTKILESSSVSSYD
jgi:hypothetical protein